MAAKGSSGATGSAATDPATFLELTELASTLLSAGELDIYGCIRRQLEREAALFTAKAPPAALAARACGGPAPGRCTCPVPLILDILFD
jgi:hypothetical protein